MTRRCACIPVYSGVLYCAGCAVDHLAHGSPVFAVGLIIAAIIAAKTRGGSSEVEPGILDSAQGSQVRVLPPALAAVLAAHYA